MPQILFAQPMETLEQFIQSNPPPLELKRARRADESEWLQLSADP